MKFRNKTSDTVYGTGLGYVEPDGEVEVPDPAGLVLQCGPGGTWEPADDAAKAAVDAATKPEPKKAPAKTKAAPETGDKS